MIPSDEVELTPLIIVAVAENPVANPIVNVVTSPDVCPSMIVANPSVDLMVMIPKTLVVEAPPVIVTVDVSEWLVV